MWFNSEDKLVIQSTQGNKHIQHQQIIEAKQVSAWYDFLCGPSIDVLLQAFKAGEIAMAQQGFKSQQPSAYFRFVHEQEPQELMLQLPVLTTHSSPEVSAALGELSKLQKEVQSYLVFC